MMPTASAQDSPESPRDEVAAQPPYATLNDVLRATGGQIALTKRRACEVLGLSVTKFDSEVAARRLRVLKRGRLVIVTAPEILRWLTPAPDERAA